MDNKSLQEIKESVRKNIKKIPYKEPNPGGQSCGVIYAGIRLYSEEIGIEIMVETHRSQLKNYDYAMMLMNLVIDDQIK